MTHDEDREVMDHETQPDEPPTLGLTLTAALPPVKGTLKHEPEDFIVEEVPSYAPSGEGAHLYLWVRSRDATTSYMVGTLARHFGVRRGDIGTAGNKDRRAVSEQWVSLPADQLEASMIEGLPASALGTISDQVSVLQAARHGNKLKTGHLRGNRFTLRVRQLEPAADEALARIQAKLAELARLGLPNYYGEQRFGRDGETLSLGLALLRGERGAGKLKPRLKRLALSAAQSEVFNRVLSARLSEGWMREVQVGDVLQFMPRGASFGIADEDEARATQLRLEAGEVAITGPLPGPRAVETSGRAAELEASVLAALGLEPSMFRRFGKLTQGTRRPLTIALEGVDCRVIEDDIELSFFLPSGTYATVLWREMATSHDDL